MVMSPWAEDEPARKTCWEQAAENSGVRLQVGGSREPSVSDQDGRHGDCTRCIKASPGGTKAVPPGVSWGAEFQELLELQFKLVTVVSRTNDTHVVVLAATGL